MADWLGLKGKTVVVTGGSSGIGRAIVEALLDLGVQVANFDLADNDLQHTHLFFQQVDVTDRQAVEAAVAATAEHFGRIDGLVNNAGINIPRLLVDKNDPQGQYELDDAVFDKVTAINQKGLYLVSQAVGRLLADQGQGVIVNMSSESGLEGSEGQSVYAGTKAAVYSYTRSWAKELGKYGVRVIGIAPGIMEATGLRTLAYEEALGYTRGKTVEEIRAGYASTSTTPLGRSGKLSEVADLTAYCLSERASYLTGVTINVAGGKTRG